MRHSLVVTVALMAGGSSLAWAGPGGFTFAAPPGWLDLSSDAPPANRDRAPPVFREQARSGTYAFVAIDIDHGGDGFMENVNGIVQSPTIPMPITRGSLELLALSVRAQLAGRGATYRCVDKKIVKIGDVDVGRVVAEIHDKGFGAMVVQYSIPGSMSHATLTFSSAPETFAHYEPLFDAAVQATRGAVTPYQARPHFVVTQVLLGVLAGGIAVVVARQRAKKKAPPAWDM